MITDRKAWGGLVLLCRLGGSPAARAILPASLPRGSSSRISIIWWGHCPSLSARIHQVSAATPAGVS